MVTDLFDFYADDNSVALRLHVQAGAGRTAVIGRHGDALKVRVAAPPEKGRANEACAKLLAEILGVAASSITLASGATSRTKRFKIADADPDEIAKRLELALVTAGVPPGGNVPGHQSVPRSPGPK